MKRIYVGTLLCIILSLGLLTGCDQGVARSLGGDMTLELEPGQKLEMITWKEDSLWYLTRPMRDDESISSIRLHDIPWIEPVELKCTYFRQDTGAIR